MDIIHDIWDTYAKDKFPCTIFLTAFCYVHFYFILFLIFFPLEPLICLGQLRVLQQIRPQLSGKCFGVDNS